ncbi:MAG: YceI family protein [Flavobacteriales bacterium]|nr:YceI family protein [Flavobacteriales bacterium]
MRKTLLFLTMAASVAFMTSCGGGSKGVETSGAADTAGTSAESVTYNVNTAESKVMWTGKKVIQGTHSGTVAISNGTLSVKGDEIESGNFTIDMTKIAEVVPEGEKVDPKFVGHISSAEFFHIDSFPMAKFEITQGGKETIKGNLTIKGITKEISIPVTQTMSENGLTATSKFTINRNDWGITWGNGTTNKIAMLKDNFISDDIEFEVHLVANK